MRIKLSSHRGDLNRIGAFLTISCSDLGFIDEKYPMNVIFMLNNHFFFLSQMMNLGSYNFVMSDVHSMGISIGKSNLKLSHHMKDRCKLIRCNKVH